jgi:hypothetical protein
MSALDARLCVLRNEKLCVLTTYLRSDRSSDLKLDYRPEPLDIHRCCRRMVRQN